MRELNLNSRKDTTYKLKTKKITPLFYLFLIGIFLKALMLLVCFQYPMPWIGVSIFIFFT